MTVTAGPPKLGVRIRLGGLGGVRGENASFCFLPTATKTEIDEEEEHIFQKNINVGPQLCVSFGF